MHRKSYFEDICKLVTNSSSSQVEVCESVAFHVCVVFMSITNRRKSVLPIIFGHTFLPKLVVKKLSFEKLLSRSIVLRPNLVLFKRKRFAEFFSSCRFSASGINFSVRALLFRPRASFFEWPKCAAPPCAQRPRCPPRRRGDWQCG